VAASHTVPHSPVVSQIPRHGVLCLYGFGIRMRMQCGHLEIEDGVGMERRKFRLPRVGHGLKRLVCISEDGFCTLAALSWLSEIGVPFVMLDRRGKVRFVTGPTAPTDARLRRTQALALQNGVGLKISRTLIDAKLEGQERVVREQIKDAVTADVIARFRLSDLPKAETFERIRTIEAHSAVAYFSAMRDISVMWPKADLRKIPAAWCSVGSRQSPLSGGPRLAVTAFHAIENYLAAVIESESRLAITALGLLPDLGLGLHKDRANRDSLVFDACEPVRPQLESWLIRWICTEPLQRRDFIERPSGNVRLTSSFAAKLSETAPTWGRLLAPWVELIAGELWSASASKGEKMLLASRLTQRNRRAVKGSEVPAVALPKPEHLCSCGARIRAAKKLCLKCWKEATHANFATGRKIANTPESLARRAATQRQQQAANRAFSVSDLPAWLTTRDAYVKQVLPALASVAKSQIRSALGVSEPYSSDIQSGKRIPARRHWQTLAELVGVSAKV
jgi:CRISPR/Cas system-associated endonuclease Cas1